jgi:hypothetical protein
MKILGTGFNEKDGALFVTFTFEKNEYMITWRPKNQDDGVVFDIGMMPVKGEKYGSNKRTNGKKSKDETSTRKDEKGRA